MCVRVYVCICINFFKTAVCIYINIHLSAVKYMYNVYSANNSGKVKSFQSLLFFLTWFRQTYFMETKLILTKGKEKISKSKMLTKFV